MNQAKSMANRQPVAPMVARAMPVSSNFLRPNISDKGPISSSDTARPMAKILTDCATSDGVVRKWLDRAGKEGSTTSSGKTASRVIVINKAMVARGFAGVSVGGCTDVSGVNQGGQCSAPVLVLQRCLE